MLGLLAAGGVCLLTRALLRRKYVEWTIWSAGARSRFSIALWGMCLRSELAVVAELKSGGKPPHSKMTKLRIFLVILAASAAAAFVLLRGPHEQQPQPPGKLRIVSLAPNVTEILFALDLGDQSSA